MAYEVLADYLQRLGVDLSPNNRKIVAAADFYTDVPSGSHIAIPSNRNLLGPWHHGLYIGNKLVIHMTGESKEDACIQQDTVNDFILGTSVIALVLYADDTDAARQASVRAALYLKDTLPTENLYNIAHFNCEHFAVLCRTGLKRYALSLLELSAYMQSPPPRSRKAGKPYHADASLNKWRKSRCCYSQ